MASDETGKSKPETSETVVNKKTADPNWQGAKLRTSGLMASPGVKFILIGIITITLLIPATMVWILVEERSTRAEDGW